MTNLTPASRYTLFGHPAGLYILFFTELWERFSYYGMRAILVLYLTALTSAEKNPGLGWLEDDALELYAWYTMLVYLMGIPGGWLADNLLGQKRTVLIGGVLLCVGHGIMAVQSMTAFYAGLGLIILGVGALKPNISTMVGGLYREKDKRRDSGFTIFYIGINIGAFLAPLLVGYVGEKINWHYGFALAGIGMVIGQVIFMLGQPLLKGIGESPDTIRINNQDEPPHRPLTKVEKDRLIVLLISFLIVLVFWGAYEQAGGLMNIYTKKKIDRMIWGYEFAASNFQSLPALYVIIFGGPVAWFWARLKNKNKATSSLFKMAIGTIIMGSGFLLMVGAAKDAQVSENGLAAIGWLFGAYAMHVLGELCTSPVALSFITKLAPPRYASLMMGAYFGVTGLGGMLAGKVGKKATEYGEYAVFSGIFICTVLLGLLTLLFMKKLKALTHGAEEDDL